MAVVQKIVRRVGFETTRLRVSYRFLRGQGVEIGALHRPLRVSPRTRVCSVDRMPVEELRKHYPELRKYRLTPVDIVDDGETLSTISDNSLDFVIANHFLEHCENPLGTIRNHLRVLNSGGILYYAIPDKSQTFDIRRPVTEFSHLVRDDVEGPGWSREQHFREWVELVSGISSRKEAEQQVQHLMEMSYSIHYHVWDEAALSEFVTCMLGYLGSCYLAHLEHNHQEFILVLKKKSPEAIAPLLSPPFRAETSDDGIPGSQRE